VRASRTSSSVTLYKGDSYLIRDALIYKARLLGNLSYLGLASTAEAEAAYKAAFDSFSPVDPNADNDGILRYHYSMFLLNAYGEKKSADIVLILKPIYTDPRYKTPANLSFFQNAPKNSAARAERMTSLALLDADFKAFLISLGWKTADFNK
jgi:hypothetical protein